VSLQATADANIVEWGFKGFMMLLVGLAYLLLAAGIINTMDDKLLDLGFVLVFFMCCAVNFVITAWFLLSGVRE